MTPSLRDVVALTKPRLSALVLFTGGGGLFLAPTSIGPVRSVVTILATTMIVAAANALNCYIERDLDTLMERTRTRPLPAKRLDPRVALWLGFVLSAVSIPALVLAANALTAVLALIALATYVLIYTPMKRKSALAMWVGAVPGAIPPLMGYTAATNRLDLAGLALFSVLFCWQIPHFIAIAIFRKEEYAKAGHKVLPLVASDRSTKLQAILWTLLLVISTLTLSPLHIAGAVFDTGASALGAIFLTCAGIGLIKPAFDARWARQLFGVSLVYLTALFALLAINAA